jgi:hypothetical protein
VQKEPIINTAEKASFILSEGAMMANDDAAREAQLKDLEIKQLKGSLRTAMQMSEAVKGELRGEVKSLGQLVLGNGGGSRLARKVEDLMNDRIEARIKNHTLNTKLTRERQQRKKVAAQRDLYVGRKSGSQSRGPASSKS